MRPGATGLLETMRVREGRIPFLDRHLARLNRSLGELSLPPPGRDVGALAAPFAEMDEGVIRAEVCDGRATMTVRRLPSLDAPAVITAAEPHVSYPHKTTERDCFDDAAAEALTAEADDALLCTHDGWVAEGTVWTLFWWEPNGGRLCTPSLDLGVLPGIGRARVTELAQAFEVRAQRAELDGKSLLLVNSVRGVIPIASLDGVTVPTDPRTERIASRFWPQTSVVASRNNGGY